MNSEILGCGVPRSNKNNIVVIKRGDPLVLLQVLDLITILRVYNICAV